MKKLSKLNIDKGKLIRSEDLTVLKGGLEEEFTCWYGTYYTSKAEGTSFQLRCADCTWGWIKYEGEGKCMNY